MISTAALRSIPAFADFPEHDLALLTGIGRTLKFEVGSAIVEQGERALAAYILLDGEVEVVRRLPDGARNRLDVPRRGGIFGAVALLDGGTRAASCRPLTESTVLEFAAADFQRLCEASTPLGARFMMVVCRQLVRDLRGTSHRISELAGVATLSAEEVARSVGSGLL